jgi:hypothetical protein
LGGSGGSHTVQFRATARSAHTLLEISEMGSFCGKRVRPKLAQSTVWARNLPKLRHSGQDFGPYPKFGLGNGPVGERVVVSKRKILVWTKTIGTGGDALSHRYSRTSYL